MLSLINHHLAVIRVIFKHFFLFPFNHKHLTFDIKKHSFSFEQDLRLCFNTLRLKSTYVTFKRHFNIWLSSFCNMFLAFCVLACFNLKVSVVRVESCAHIERVFLDICVDGNYSELFTKCQISSKKLRVQRKRRSIR